MRVCMCVCPVKDDWWGKGRKWDNVGWRPIVLLSVRWTISRLASFSLLKISQSVNQILYFLRRSKKTSNKINTGVSKLMVKNISFLIERENLRCVSVYCQVSLSTAASMGISFFFFLILSFFSLKCLHSFFPSVSLSIGLWLPFLLFNSFEKKRGGICHTTTYLIVSNKKKEFVVLKCSKEIR